MPEFLKARWVCRTLNELGGHSQVNHETFLEYFNASTDLVMQSPLVSAEDKIRVFTANQRRVRHLQGLVALGGLGSHGVENPAH